MILRLKEVPTERAAHSLDFINDAVLEVVGTNNPPLSVRPQDWPDRAFPIITPGLPQSTLGNLANCVPTAVRIGHVERALRIIVPLPVHEKAVVMVAGR